MDSLPIEVVDIITDNLMPKYRCRFAMTSKCYYKHYNSLYSDLFRWCAKISPIQAPKCESVFDKSVYCIDNKVFSYGYGFYNAGNDWLIVTNLTNNTYLSISDHSYKRNFTIERMPMDTHGAYIEASRYESIIAIDEYRKCVHKDVLIANLNMKLVFYKDFDNNIKSTIRSMFDDNTNNVVNSCEHISHII